MKAATLHETPYPPEEPEDRRQRILREALRSARKETAHMTQETLAGLLGYKNRSSVARMEKGLTKISYYKAIQWADIVGFPLGLIDQIFTAGDEDLKKLEERLSGRGDFGEIPGTGDAKTAMKTNSSSPGKMLSPCDLGEQIRELLTPGGCYRVLDDSMASFRIPCGAVVFLETPWTIRENDIGIFQIGERKVIRKVFLNEHDQSGLLVSGDLDRYPVIPVTDFKGSSVRPVGRVCHINFTL